MLRMELSAFRKSQAGTSGTPADVLRHRQPELGGRFGELRVKLSESPGGAVLVRFGSCREGQSE